MKRRGEDNELTVRFMTIGHVIPPHSCWSKESCGERKTFVWYRFLPHALYLPFSPPYHMSSGGGQLNVLSPSSGSSPPLPSLTPVISLSLSFPFQMRASFGKPVELVTVVVTILRDKGRQ